MLVDELGKLVDSVVIRTDRVRLMMRNSPRYTASEMVWVYEVCQRIIEMRLRRGQRVIFDGTNYQAARRERLFEVAHRINAVVSIGHVQASEQAIRDRLVARNSGKRRTGDLSDADWSVYQWMVHAQEPIERPHLVLDTTNIPADVLAARLRDYWFKREREHASRNHHFQSDGWTSQL